MTAIDVRVPFDFTRVNHVLLEMAEHPLRFTKSILVNERAGVGSEPFIACELARQACATVVSNCVMMISSETAAWLQVIAKDFQPAYEAWVAKDPRRRRQRNASYESARRFVEQTRLGFEAYISLLFHMCATDYEGTPTQQNISLILDMRNELQHDKPEGHGPEFSEERLQRAREWHSRLLPGVGREALEWIPQVHRPNAVPGVRVVGGIRLTGDAVIMKFMRFPIAAWVARTTDDILREMSLTMSLGGGKLRTCDESFPLADRYTGPDAELINRLWLAGE